MYWCLRVLQITLWGPPSSHLHDYAYKLWSGLAGDFYTHRWVSWFNAVSDALHTGAPFDQAQFTTTLVQWEDTWSQQLNENYPTEPTGNSLQVAAKLYAKYFSE